MNTSAETQRELTTRDTRNRFQKFIGFGRKNAALKKRLAESLALSRSLKIQRFEKDTEIQYLYTHERDLLKEVCGHQDSNYLERKKNERLIQSMARQGSVERALKQKQVETEEALETSLAHADCLEVKLHDAGQLLRLRELLDRGEATDRHAEDSEDSLSLSHSRITL